MNDVVFVSKVDGWLLAVLWGSALACLIAAGAVVMNGGPGALLTAVFIVGLGGALPLWFVGSTRYTFSGAELHVRCGPLQWRIPLTDVRSVTPTRNPLSSPALSLDRLRIDYGLRSIMVSPLDKDGFLRELRARRGR